MVDLGAAPGGWSQVAAKRVGAGKGRVVAIDLLDMDADRRRRFRAARFSRCRCAGRLKRMLGGEADVVLSDMAANATGHRKTDHLKIMALVEAAARICARSAQARRRVSRQGDARRHRSALLAELRQDFASVQHVKPAASRADSAELYLLATGFRGRA